MRHANDGLRFLLELSALAALAVGGWHATDGAVRWLLALAAPAAMATVWGVWLAPRSDARVGDPARLALEILVFGAAAGALLVAGSFLLALVLASIVALHLGLTFVLGQR